MHIENDETGRSLHFDVTDKGFLVTVGREDHTWGDHIQFSALEGIMLIAQLIEETAPELVDKFVDTGKLPPLAESILKKIANSFADDSAYAVRETAIEYLYGQSAGVAGEYARGAQEFEDMLSKAKDSLRALGVTESELNRLGE